MAAFSKFTEYGSSVATMMFALAIYQKYFPSIFSDSIESITSRYTHKLYNYFSPYLDIVFEEHNGDHFYNSAIYSFIKDYLSDKSSMQARSMKADYVDDAKDGKSLLLSLGDDEEIVDYYKGVKVRWSSHREVITRSFSSPYPSAQEKRYYRLNFHRRDRKLILETYLPYVLEEGVAIAERKGRRKLATNAGTNGSEWQGNMWSQIDFKHPARFEMLAMEQSKKQMIIDDLLWFKSAKDYYTNIGKPWKRGYLLYGPPGTGKSTMVAAMANLLDYDIYDLELTSVTDNMQLRRLLMEISSRSIILIEDIDCSFDLTGQRKDTTVNNEEECEDNPEKEVERRRTVSKVTLSGLLNFVDGIWSACGEERIIVFTTNHIDMLDPALIRRGRMDLHIELSYCRFEAFKVLAMNYLRIEAHPLFEIIGRLVEEVDITPADVAENLMPRSLKINVDACLENLVGVLEKLKEKKKLTSDEMVFKEDKQYSTNEVSVIGIQGHEMSRLYVYHCCLFHNKVCHLRCDLDIKYSYSFFYDREYCQRIQIDG